MIPERVVAIRKHLGWTQERLAEELHISPSTVARWETGRVKPTQHFAHALEALIEGIDPVETMSTERIRALRTRLGYTGLKGAKELAKRLRIHWRTVYHWEEGVIPIGKEAQERLLELEQEVATNA